MPQIKFSYWAHLCIVCMLLGVFYHLKCYLLYVYLIVQAFICSWLHLFVPWLKWWMHLQAYRTNHVHLWAEVWRKATEYGSVVSNSLEIGFSAFFLRTEMREFHFYVGLLYKYSRYHFLKQETSECSFKEIYMGVGVYAYFHSYTLKHLFLSSECSEPTTLS